MKIKFHPHAEQRMLEGGVTKEEVIETVKKRRKFSS